MQKKNTVIFERGSWYYRYKVTGEGSKTKYMKKGGFATKEEVNSPLSSRQLKYLK